MFLIKEEVKMRIKLVVCFLLMAALAGLMNVSPVGATGHQNQVFENSKAADVSNAAAVFTGGSHSCLLDQVGGVFCWGDNRFGQLGNGTTRPHFVPMQVAGLESGVSSLALGDEHTCALLQTGGVKCWGGNYYGQLGNGSWDAQYMPVNVSSLSSGVVTITAGDYHTCATTSGGAAKCWGSNYYGGLGNNSTEDANTPVNVAGLSSGVSSLSAGGYFTCAIVNGGARCWGLNAVGQLGDDSYIDRHIAVNVYGLASGVLKLAAGEGHTCAIISGGSVKCWGGNFSGELGNYTTNNSPVPVQVIGLTSDVLAVDTGGNFSCALLSSGGFQCWGENSNGEIGDGTITDRLTPVAVQGLMGSISGFSSGYSHTCVVYDSGAIQCWGDNNKGQLGTGRSYFASSPVDVSGLSSGAAEVSVDGNATCALTSAGGVKCWGDNLSGRLGDGTQMHQAVPVDVIGLSSGVSLLAVGDGHACAAMTAGGVKCWGSNAGGELGNGTATFSATPVNVSGITEVIVSLSAGYGHSCAVTAGGAVKCWGSNYAGQLGNGSNENSLVPVNVNGLSSGVSLVTSGRDHVCVALSAGGIKCWGYGLDGQLGDGFYNSASSPISVAGISGTASALAAGNEHSCVVIAGEVKCWGDNVSGQLGSGNWVDSPTPVNVVNLSNITRLSAGGYFTCAGSGDTPLYCWGNNYNGSLGIGSSSFSNMPMPVIGFPNGILGLDAGGSTACAISSTGVLRCWGYNYYGQVGAGWFGFSPQPETVLAAWLSFIPGLIR